MAQAANSDSSPVLRSPLWQLLPGRTGAIAAPVNLSAPFKIPGLKEWPRFWPIPMTMLLYAAQVRIERRFPPRPVPLPNFLPLKRAEWYITFGFLATVESENSRNYNRTKRDPDLCVLEAAALKAKVSWKARKKTVKMENMPFLQSDVGRSYFYPLSTASVLERLRWSYDHCWSNASLWNLFAYRIIKEGVYMKDTIPDCPQFSQHDIDVVITHNANSVQSADEWFTDYAALPYILLCLTTPIAFYFRYRATRPLLFRCLNGLQRMQAYAAAILFAAQRYQHWSYPHMIQDKHAVAQLIRRVVPNVDDITMEMMQ